MRPPASGARTPTLAGSGELPKKSVLRPATRVRRYYPLAAILIVACAIALVELDIAVTIVTGAFLITFGALALSVALAFGLGSRRAVESMWEQRFRHQKDEPEEKAGKPEPK